MTDDRKALAWIKKQWCAWTHGGGRIDRDPAGRINWQCSRCGRWSDYPVSRHDERRVIDSALIAQAEGER